MFSSVIVTETEIGKIWRKNQKYTPMLSWKTGHYAWSGGGHCNNSKRHEFRFKFKANMPFT